MGGINPPAPTPCTAHKFEGEEDQSVDLELSARIFCAQKYFTEFLIGIDKALLEERRNNYQVSSHRMLLAADCLANSIDELGNAIMFLDLYVNSLRHPNTPEDFRSLLVEETLHEALAPNISGSNISALVMSDSYEAGLLSIRQQAIGIAEITSDLKKETSVMVSMAREGSIENSLSMSDSGFRGLSHRAAENWSQLVLDWAAMCSIGMEAYRRFHTA